MYVYEHFHNMLLAMLFNDLFYIFTNSTVLVGVFQKLFNCQLKDSRSRYNGILSPLYPNHLYLRTISPFLPWWFLPPCRVASLCPFLYGLCSLWLDNVKGRINFNDVDEPCLASLFLVLFFLTLVQLGTHTNVNLLWVLTHLECLHNLKPDLKWKLGELIILSVIWLEEMPWFWLIWLIFLLLWQ